MLKPRTTALLRYNGYRLLLLVAVGGLGYLAGLRGLPLIAAALLASGVLSYFLLYKQRSALAALLVEAVDAGRSRFAERTAREDAAAEAWHEQAGKNQRPAGSGIADHARPAS